VNARIDYALPDMGLTVALFSTNLFNKKYVAACTDGDSGCYFGERLQVIGSVKYRW